MFNLFRSRQKVVRYMLSALLGVVALTMVAYLIPGFGTPGTKADDPTVAEIGPNKLSAQDVILQVGRILQGQNVPPEMMQVYLPNIMDNMIQQRALVYQFESMGMTASDDEIYNMLAAGFPQFFQNGVLVNKDQFESFLLSNGQTLADVIEQARQSVIYLKIENLEYAAAVVTPKEVDDAIGQKFDKAKIKYVAFAPEKFKSQPTVTPDEMKSFFNARRSDYTMPEKRSFTVVSLDQDKVEQTISVTDAQLHAAYNSNLDNFRMPERTHVRHILVMTQGKSDAEKKPLLAKAQDLLKQVKGGADFAQVAMKSSDDTSNAPKGGDLGWVVHGQMVPEFEKPAFALQKGQISDIVTSPFGYHIIQCLEKESTRLKPFEEVKAQLTEELRKQSVADKMQAIGEQMRAALTKSPGSAAEVAKQFGANPIGMTNTESGAPIPTLGVVQEIDSTVSSLKKGEVSPVLTLPANRLAVVVLNDKTPTRLAEFNEVEAKVRDTMLGQKAEGVAADKAKEAAGRMKSGEDMAKVAKSMGLTVTDSIEFTHTDSVEGLGSAVYVQDAFTKPVGQVVGPVNVQGRNVVYQIVDQVHVDPSKLTNERQAIQGELKKVKAKGEMEMLLDATYTKLLAEKKVRVNKDAIKRLLASTRR